MATPVVVVYLLNRSAVRSRIRVQRGDCGTRPEGGEGVKEC